MTSHYHHHREHQVAHRRVHHILKEHPEGAKHHAKHGGAFSKVTSKTAAERHDDVRGHKAPKKYARGGRTKGHKGQQTNIAIMMPHKGAGPGGPPMPPGAGPGGPPLPLPGGPPGMPPGMPPGGPPPGMPMRARGGRTEPDIDGESSEANIKAWSKRASKNSYARGGRLDMTGGAATGVGRLEQTEHEKRKHGRK